MHAELDQGNALQNDMYSVFSLYIQLLTEQDNCKLSDVFNFYFVCRIHAVQYIVK